MLIVNADDWGLRRDVTDAIAECWAAGAINSASAMVGIADSGRAFELAAQTALPLGLHLNLTLPFDGTVGEEAARRQRQAVGYFQGRRWRRYGFDPFARAALDLAVADQLAAFAAGTGAAPRHADGHQHIQACPTVVSLPSLGAVASLREAHAPLAGRPHLKSVYRVAVNRGIRARFRSVPFFSLRDLHPALGGADLGRLRDLARRGPVEVMTHPAWEDERRVLLSDSWRSLLAELPLGAHAEAS